MRLVAKFAAGALTAYATYRFVTAMREKNAMEAESLHLPRDITQVEGFAKCDAETREWAGKLYSVARGTDFERKFVNFSNGVPLSAVDKWARNMLQINVEKPRVMQTHGWIIAGHAITTSHAFLPFADEYHVLVRNASVIRGDTRLLLKEKDLHRVGDLVSFKISSLASVKFVNGCGAPIRNLKGGDAMYMGAAGDRPAMTGSFVGYGKCDYPYMPGKNVGEQDGFYVDWETPTIAGDCGRPIFCVERGYEFHGVHAAGNSKGSGFALDWPGSDILIPMKAEAMVMDDPNLVFGDIYMPIS